MTKSLGSGKISTIAISLLLSFCLSLMAFTPQSLAYANNELKSSNMKVQSTTDGIWSACLLNDGTLVLLRNWAQSGSPGFYTYQGDIEDIFGATYTGTVYYNVNANRSETGWLIIPWNKNEILSMRVATGQEINLEQDYYLFKSYPNITSMDLYGFHLNSPGSIANSFSNNPNLTYVDVSTLNVDHTMDMSGLFEGCTSIKNIDMSNVNMSEVRNTSSMFKDCPSLSKVSFKSDLETTKLLYCSEMFYGDSSLQELNLSSFNTTSVLDMRDMFTGCDKLNTVDLSITFSFKGNDIADSSKWAILPTPNSNNAAGADGKWYNKQFGAYSPSELQSQHYSKRMYGIWYASKNLIGGNVDQDEKEEEGTITLNYDGIEGAVYDSKERTLTLTNVNARMLDKGSYITVPGGYGDKTTINLVGSNTFMSEAPYSRLAIDCGDADVVVKGSGSIRCVYMGLIQARSLNFQSGTYSVLNSPRTIITAVTSVDIAKKAKMSLNTKNSSGAVISANRVNNSYTSLTSVGGSLACGTEVKTTSGIWKIDSENSSAVALEKYTGSKKAININAVKIGGIEYAINKVCKNAFNNSKGKKIKTLKIGNNVRTIVGYAFNGMKSVTKLNMKDANGIIRITWSNNAQKVKFDNGVKKNAFKGLGKNSAKSMKVYSSLDTKYKSKLMTIMKKKGLNKKSTAKLFV